MATLLLFWRRISPLVIVAAIAAAGLAHILTIFLSFISMNNLLSPTFRLDHRYLSSFVGAISRTTAIMVNVYLLSFASIFAALVKRSNKVKSEETG